MFKYSRSFALTLCLVVALNAATGQAPSKPPEAASPAKTSDQKPAATKSADSKPDYSKEAFVDEDDVTKLVFENDGTSTRENATRIHIQSDAALQRYGVLTFPYQNATETVEIGYVRARKPDGTVVTTPIDSAQDMPSDITRQAPFYSDLHEKHVAVKGLSVGDVLEYQTKWHVTKPLAPGQFWTAFNFPRDFIVLHEEIQISVPRDRAIKWKSDKNKPVITEEGGRRIFTWTSSQLEAKSAEQQKKDAEELTYKTARGKLPPPDIQISTFLSWEEVGAWYSKMQEDRVAPTAEIRAKALELTKGAPDDNAKMHAIYNYVSTQFRYIGVAFGIGRYQPHSAAEVLANQYGDCKDKHTLLASLLEAAGIKAYPALINVYRELDADVPSPAQFDHVITAVPQGKDYVWLDTTAEVAPFGYLLTVLRDKPALVMPSDKPASLTKTVLAQTAPRLETFKIEAKLDDTGTLQGKVDHSLSGGDEEVLFRAGFRRVPLTQWNELAQQVSYASGFSGDVSQVTAGTPDKTDEPFHFSYTYTRKDYPLWSERRISSPLPFLMGAVPDEKPNHPLFLGEIGRVEQLSEVELPAGYFPELPAKVNLNEDFAEYHAAYSVSKGVLQTERQLIVKVQEVPLAEYEAFKKFVKAVTDDREVYVYVSNSTSTQPSAQTSATNLQTAIWSLPNSDNAEAARLQENAIADVRGGDAAGATAKLNQALKLDPKFARAWMLLAGVYATQGQRDQAVDTLRKANDAVPNNPTIYKSLVTSLMELQQYQEAVTILQALSKTDPSNVDVLSTLGGAYNALKRYPEAAATIEAAVKLAPDRAPLHFQLGLAYLNAENEPSALTAFKKALELDPSPLMFNNVGWYMADANKQLPLSLEYAQRAVHDEEDLSSTIDLSRLKVDDLRRMISLASYWDTLGWVYFRMGAYDQAEKYLSSAWELSQGSIEGDHLAQVYQKDHKKAEAIRMYRLALATYPKGDLANQIQSRLKELGGTPPSARPGDDSQNQLNRMRTVPLTRLASNSASAEFFVIFGKDGKIEGAKFVSGSDQLKAAEQALRDAKFKFQFPDDGPTHILRRGVLGCFSSTGCSLVLYNPADVHSVN